ncbi:MAG: hypothetical protein AB8B56_06155 [Crocinitomicaceae bacterium]
MLSKIYHQLLKRLDQLDLVLSLSFPAVMAVLAILDHSPYSKWLAFGGWLFMILYVLFALVFRNRSIQRNEPVTRRNATIQLLGRIVLLLIIPGAYDFDRFQDYFYASTAGAGLSIVVALLVAFIHKGIKDAKSAKQFGLGLIALIVCLIGVVTYPFIAEIVRHFSEKELSSILYLVGTFIFEFSSVYIIFAKFIKSNDSAIGPDVENAAIFIVIPLGWFLGLGALSAIVNG